MTSYNYADHRLPPPGDMTTKLFCKIQVVVNSRSLSNAAHQVVPKEFGVVVRTDTGRHPYRFDQFNIVVYMTDDNGEMTVQVAKNSCRKLDAYKVSGINEARSVLAELCQERIDQLKELWDSMPQYHR